ncbi:MAG TPA: FUSC family protein [Micromonosporaceae bacterium]|nr:FUSC family protein [Micromonosporaceae bacterium]
MSRPGWLGAALGRLRDDWLLIGEATVAATVAWLIATELLGNPEPFFAPVAALITLLQVRGQRMRRAVEVILGVAGGVLVADIVVQALGPHTTWTIVTVLLITLTLAVAIGASPVSVVQAAVSAMYLVVVAPPTQTLVPLRFIDALVGGGVALLVSQLAVVRDPLAPLVRESRQLFGELAGVISDVADALDRHDEAAARAALTRARSADTAVERLRTAVSAADEGLRLHVLRRERRDRVQAVDAATEQLDYAVRNVRVLARAAVTLTRLPAAPPLPLGAAVRSLVAAVYAVDKAFAADLAGSGDAAQHNVEWAETVALDAVRAAGQLLPDGPPLPLIMIIGQIRTTAIDLLRGAGSDDIEILTRVDRALGLPPV